MSLWPPRLPAWRHPARVADEVAVFLVPSDGFEVREDPRPHSGDGWLVPRGAFVPAAPEPASRLLGRFAALGSHPGTESIVTFANRFGFLTEGQERLPAAGGEAVVGEPLARWREECERFAELWQVWQAIRTADEPQLLDARIRWHRQADATWPGYVVAAAFSGGARSFMHRRLRRWSHMARSRSALAPYRTYLARRSAERLVGHAAAILDEERGELRFDADCLLGTIYARFAEEVLRGSSRSSA